MMGAGLIPTFGRGLALGFSIAAPVGPIGVLCIRRTLADGRMVGLATGLGAAAADGLYGAVAAFGLRVLSDALVGQRLWIQLVGGLFLLSLGFRTFRTRPSDRVAEARGAGLAGAFGSTFALTLTNPMTILSFVAVFAALGLGAAQDRVSAVALVCGVVVGSALWWLTLSAAVDRVRGRFDARAMAWVNRISGLVISAFGVVSLATLRAEGS
jgi:threonine/homoserine/homoserine lactone efflux protein